MFVPSWRYRVWTYQGIVLNRWNGAACRRVRPSIYPGIAGNLTVPPLSIALVSFFGNWSSGTAWWALALMSVWAIIRGTVKSVSGCGWFQWLLISSPLGIKRAHWRLPWNLCRQGGIMRYVHSFFTIIAKASSKTHDAWILVSLLVIPSVLDVGQTLTCGQSTVLLIAFAILFWLCPSTWPICLTSSWGRNSPVCCQLPRPSQTLASFPVWRSRPLSIF